MIFKITHLLCPFISLFFSSELPVFLLASCLSAVCLFNTDRHNTKCDIIKRHIVTVHEETGRRNQVTCPEDAET